MGVKHSASKSFIFAFQGILAAFKKEPNFKIHTGLGILAIVLALVLKFSALEWIVLILTIATVLILELLNTSIEAIVDLVSPEIHEEAKIAKDVSAAAVLISAIAALVIGALLFIPKVLL